MPLLIVGNPFVAVAQPTSARLSLSERHKPMKPELEKTLLTLVGRATWLEARSLALESALCALAQRKCGVSAGVLEKLISELTAAAHQKLLERLESVDPAAAAYLDSIKPPMPEIPDSLL